MRERRRLGEKLEGQTVPRIVGIEQITREGEQLAPILRNSILAHTVEFFQPMPRLRRGKARLIGSES